MKFEEVLPALKAGKKIRRRTWCKDTYIYINSYGKFETQSGRHYDIIINGLYDLKHDGWEIVKEKKKIKIRDLNEEQYVKWRKSSCCANICASSCPFRCINCCIGRNNYKEMYSDKFLDQEIEVEE